MMSWVVWLVVVVGFASADEYQHSYKEGEQVKVWANKAGPYDNPLETYEYFRLPLCAPSKEEWTQRFPSLGEALQGDELVEHVHLTLNFKTSVATRDVCRQPLTGHQAKELRQAVRENYWYQYYIDDLPVWGTLGKMLLVGPDKSNRVPHIYTHQHFSLGYNDLQLVIVNLTTSKPVEIPRDGGVIPFTYSVSWEKSSIAFPHRFKRYLEEGFFESRIHWLSIINSSMLVMFLVVVVVMVLSRTVKADYQRILQRQQQNGGDAPAVPELEGQSLEPETGWKQLPDDVFRVPPYPCLFAALVGTGCQLTVMALCIVVIGIATSFYANRGALLTDWILAWALTSEVAGYCSASLFAQYSAVTPAYSNQWIRTMLYTAFLFPGACVVVVFLMNFVAWGYHSSQAIPAGTMVIVLCIWGCVAFPLVIFGTIVGRHLRLRSRKDVPRVTHVPRVIPRDRPWFLLRSTLVLGGGVLPFASIFIELYFVFTSFWSYKFYYVYGFMLLAFIILVLVTLSVSVTATYLLLNSEDHRWTWTSVGIGGCTAGYVFAYSVYFFIHKTKMSGLLMVTLYFGYMGLFSAGFGLLVASVSFLGAHWFVKTVYGAVKFD